MNADRLHGEQVTAVRGSELFGTVPLLATGHDCFEDNSTTHHCKGKGPSLPCWATTGGGRHDKFFLCELNRYRPTRHQLNWQYQNAKQ